MITTCGDAITFPLKLMFKSIINEGVFPDDWKKNNLVPIHKKDSENLIKNYRPISLLQIFSKVFERLVFNTLFNFFLQNKISPPTSLDLYQVIPVFHDYYQLHMKFVKVLIATHPPI